MYIYCKKLYCCRPGVRWALPTQEQSTLLTIADENVRACSLHTEKESLQVSAQRNLALIRFEASKLCHVQATITAVQGGANPSGGLLRAPLGGRGKIMSLDA